MSELEDKLNSVLSNPQMMQQIMALAQSMGSASSQAPQEPPEPASPSLDPGMLRQLAGIAGGAGVDQHQQALLRALGPYISRERSGKLEKAMRAAKMANLASALLQSGALQSMMGR